MAESKRQNRVNLNKLAIPRKNARPTLPRILEDYGCRSDDGDVEVVFRNIEERLIDFIDEADIILGCVAWLTNKSILKALSRKVAVSLVVQKEDFLRPDLNVSPNWARDLRALYDALPGGLNIHATGNEETLMAAVSDEFKNINPVRCVGCHNSNRDPAFPRMHHKFIVACRGDNEDSSDVYNFPEPYAVWTGSFNFTGNATNCLENAVILRDNWIYWAYYHEYAQISVLAEPLDWSAAWVAPEWHVG